MDILVIETAICHSYVASLVSKVSTLTAAVLQHEKYEVSHGRPMSGVKGINCHRGGTPPVQKCEHITRIVRQHQACTARDILKFQLHECGNDCI